MRTLNRSLRSSSCTSLWVLVSLLPLLLLFADESQARISEYSIECQEVTVAGVTYAKCSLSLPDCVGGDRVSGVYFLGHFQGTAESGQKGYLVEAVASLDSDIEDIASTIGGSSYTSRLGFGSSENALNFDLTEAVKALAECDDDVYFLFGSIRQAESDGSCSPVDVSTPGMWKIQVVFE